MLDHDLAFAAQPKGKRPQANIALEQTNITDMSRLLAGNTSFACCTGWKQLNCALVPQNPISHAYQLTCLFIQFNRQEW